MALQANDFLETPAGRDLTSARLNSVFTVHHGRVEARIKVPPGSGLWPAFWMLGAIIWRLDDVPYRTLHRADVPTWPFDGPMFLLLNLAVGGGWPGNALGKGTLPATMLVDWVRVRSAP
jgi:beta-glucanase (GH16 family)